MVIGQNPGRLEVRWHEPFVGPSGDLLKQALVGFWDGRIYVTNAVLCHPGPDHQITEPEIEACASRLREDVRTINPSVILVLGQVAKRALSRIEGLHAPVAYAIHPAAVVRTKGRAMSRGAWVHAVRAAIRRVAPPTQQNTPFVYAKTETCPPWQDDVVGLDTEYGGLEVWEGPRVVGVASRRGDVWVTRSPSPDIVRWLQDRCVVAHHAVNEAIALMALDADHVPSSWHDSMILSALDDEEGARDLKTLAAAHLGIVYDIPRLREIATDDRTLQYCGNDALAALRLTRLYRHLMTRPLYVELYRPLIVPLALMGFGGVPVHLGRAQEEDAALREEATRIEEALRRYAEINWHSPEQVAQYLSSRYPIEKRTATGKLSVDKEVIHSLAARGVEEASLLEALRQATKIRSTYLEKLLVSGGVIRTVPNPVGTESGRISMTGGRGRGMNLQNVPTRLRHLFVAPPGSVWVEADASQMEVRVLAWLAERHQPIRPLSTDLRMTHDLYAEVGRFVLGRDPSPEEREVFKMVLLATVYLASPATLVRQAALRGVSLSPHVVERYMEAINARYPTIRRWQYRMFDEAREHGYITTPFGRRRHVQVSPDGSLSHEARKALVNSPVQGTASDFILRALVRLKDGGVEFGMRRHLDTGKAAVVVTVHDSISLLCRQEESVEVAEEVRRAIERDPVFEGEYYLRAKVTCGPSWGEQTTPLIGGVVQEQSL